MRGAPSSPTSTATAFSISTPASLWWRPDIVIPTSSAVQDQAARLIHMSGTDFYYENMVQLAETLARLAPGDQPRRVYFGNSGTGSRRSRLEAGPLPQRTQPVHRFPRLFPRAHSGLARPDLPPSVQRAGFGPFMPGVHHLPYPTATAAPMASRPIPAASSARKPSRTTS